MNSRDENQVGLKRRNPPKKQFCHGPDATHCGGFLKYSWRIPPAFRLNHARLQCTLVVRLLATIATAGIFYPGAIRKDTLK